ncbi:uncharacterized protein METZ01_LOCUS515220, partial [marine metagenome]
MIERILNLTRNNKRLLMILADSVAIIFVLVISFSIRLGFWYYPPNDLLLVIFGSPIVAIPIFIRFGLYHSIIRYIGFKELWEIIQSVSLYAILWGVAGLLAAIDGIPRSVIVINWLLAILVIGGMRMVARWLLSGSESTKNKKNVVIYGAGSAGRQLAIALTQSDEYFPVAFIDDALDKQKQSINGLEICSPDALRSLVEEKNVKEVLLAIPGISRSQRNEII